MIPLFIPYVNRPDLLNLAMLSVPHQHWPALKVIDNSSGHDLRKWTSTGVTFLRAPVPLTFAQTQNWMLRMSEDTDAPFYLFMHSDAEAEGDSVQRLVAMANDFTIQGRKWGAIFTAYDALAAFNTAAFRAVGGWDTFLEWYCSDNDMYHRLRLAGYEIIESGLPVAHTPSQTLNADPMIRFRVDLMIPWRHAYYAQKWGGSPGNEIYSTPFNRPAV